MPDYNLEASSYREKRNLRDEHIKIADNEKSHRTNMDSATVCDQDKSDHRTTTDAEVPMVNKAAGILSSDRTAASPRAGL